MLLALASPAGAGGCRLALVLALDVSSSVDEAEYGLQREGLARALVDPEVARLFLTGDPVALYVFEWASPSMQEALLPDWVLVETEDDLARVATTLLEHPRTGAHDRQRSTAVGAALIHAGEALGAASDCAARTVDVSGDGRSNVGFDPRYVYANYPFDGVTVNALVVSSGVQGGGHPSGDDELTLWFQSNVLRGRDAFWVLADGYEDFQRAMTAKLLRELTTPAVSGWPAEGHAG
ncbi:identified by similarity to GB.1 [Rubellimicrobium mesophilum DSM 19309]|uniref:Identified by similarity to GB.1 n=1 Tax=Rubellimicrobium mesophilum DSM 19309 TaxID=442562 RepID=A0A017HVS8_9RHOB|nr:identified by similarity to GB.1 [Rubellimicrobium mesophilum DSM 19309]